MTTVDKPWHARRLAAFDLEATGKDPEEARIVQYAIASIGGGPSADTAEAIVNPGVEIPAEAAGIHGITTERAAAEGQPWDKALDFIIDSLIRAIEQGYPIVGHNISYDLTVLDRECRRYDGRGLEDALGRPVAPVIDSLVLSKKVDPYRRRVSETQGAHQLKTCVQTLLPAGWGIAWDDEQAHDALYDCLMSARVVVAVARQYPQIGGMGLAELHDAQVGWRAEQCASLQSYLRSPKAGVKRDPGAVVRPEWPFIPPTTQPQENR